MNAPFPDGGAYEVRANPEFDPTRHGAVFCSEPGCVWATGHESGRCSGHRPATEADRVDTAGAYEALPPGAMIDAVRADDAEREALLRGAHEAPCPSCLGLAEAAVDRAAVPLQPVQPGGFWDGFRYAQRALRKLREATPRADERSRS